MGVEFRDSGFTIQAFGVEGVGLRMLSGVVGKVGAQDSKFGAPELTENCDPEVQLHQPSLNHQHRKDPHKNV